MARTSYVALILAVGCGTDTVAPGPITTTIVLDQENLLDGSIGGQGIGRFSDFDGSPDPTGNSFDFQDAQTWMAGLTGQLASIRLPIRNLQGGTVDITLEIRSVVNLIPNGDDNQTIGSVTAPAPDANVDIADPETWVTFDVSGLEVDVTPGAVLAFSVRTTSVIPYLYNPESTLGYARGTGYRRNQALTNDWTSPTGSDFGFQIFVAVPN